MWIDPRLAIETAYLGGLGDRSISALELAVAANRNKWFFGALLSGLLLATASGCINRARHGLILRGDWTLEMNRIPWMQDRSTYQPITVNSPCADRVYQADTIPLDVTPEPSAVRPAPRQRELVEPVPPDHAVEATSVEMPLSRGPAQVVRALFGKRKAPCGMCSTHGVLLSEQHSVSPDEPGRRGVSRGVARFFPVPTRPAFAPRERVFHSEVRASQQAGERTSTTQVRSAGGDVDAARKALRQPESGATPAPPELTVLPPAPIVHDAKAEPLHRPASSQPRRLDTASPAGTWIYVPLDGGTQSLRSVERPIRVERN